MTPELERLARILPRTKPIIQWFVDNRTRVNLVYPPHAPLELAEKLRAQPEEVRAALRDLRPWLVRLPAGGGFEWWSLRGVSERESGELTLDVWAAVRQHRLTRPMIHTFVGKNVRTSEQCTIDAVANWFALLVIVVTADDAVTARRMLNELATLELLRQHEGWWRVFASRESATPLGDEAP